MDNRVLSRRVIERLEEHVGIDPDRCWNWTGGLNQFGYGLCRNGYEMRGVHKLAYLYWKGLIPDGLWVLHTCDNRRCINPAHLWLGTARDNNQDTWNKGRHPGRYGRNPYVKKAPETVP